MTTVIPLSRLEANQERINTAIIELQRQQKGVTTVTATSDGLTTGIVPKDTKFVAVTSGNAAHIVALPQIVAADVGLVVRGYVGATGFEMQTFASSGDTINNVDSDGTNSAAIPATTFFTVTLVADNTWILEATDELGAVITAIVPN